MVKLICFDLDGVLVDTVDWHYKSFNQAFTAVTGQEGISKEDQEDIFNGRPTPVKLDMLISMGRCTAEQAGEIASLKSRIFQQMVEEQLVPDISKIDMMLFLKEQGYKIAVVSNCNFKNTYLLLDRIGVIDQIDYRVSASDVERPKPSPQGYLKAMTEFDADDTTTIIFEDSPVGLRAATAACENVVEVKSVKQVTYGFVINEIRKAQEKK